MEQKSCLLDFLQKSICCQSHSLATKYRLFAQKKINCKAVNENGGGRGDGQGGGGSGEGRCEQSERSFRSRKILVLESRATQ